ncbi:L-pipecolate oxidase [Lachnellula occidentalis]|uniref:L-pipecolate oxidase n=1 Tax=Lachnellula occidentalis TaxID=215460 RepID=A0A8H8S0E2_9HELO|nr:L-pipecolate oxidase [Lachnellula occidentalis]
MTFEAIDAWNSWNDELATGNSLPPGLSREDKVFHKCGSLNIADSKELPPWELATIRAMEEQGHIDTQLVTTNPRHVAISKSRGQNISPFEQAGKERPIVGVLDLSGGVAVADKACRFALHKAQQLGVKVVFDAVAGAFESLEYSLTPSGSLHKVIGVRTKDKKLHRGEQVILACGGWTPSLLPTLDGLCEATAGSVALIKLPPKSSSPELWDRFSPENFPTWMYRMRDGASGGLYGFPRDDNGFIKIGYRGTKYTNPKAQRDGKERSIPVTRWSDGEKLTQIPKQAMSTIQGFVHDFMPELELLGIAMTRVPGFEGLMVATGGSGHAFKYLPILGDFVVDVLEDNETRPVLKRWKWRTRGEEKPVNVLMEGSIGTRALSNVPLSSHGAKCML